VILAQKRARMTSLLVNPTRKRTRFVHLAIATLTALIATGHYADARSSRRETAIEFVQSRTAAEPIMAIVSLRDQRITVYDVHGWIMRALVSSGQRGRETPAGIFSVIQKDAEHYSNLYDDAYMPNMQRITWSGIALHGGVLPGYAASHARAAADTAETSRAAAAETARQAMRQLAPVSVLISRKTQKLYVRQTFEPVFDSPVTVADPDRPIGTHIFTAMERAGSDAPMRWSVVTLEGTDDAKAALRRHDRLARRPQCAPRHTVAGAGPS
jgi:hypothetical protein